MARVNNTIWNRYKYKLNGLVLILPFIFLYQSLTPEFPPTWQPKDVGSFSVTPMPYNLDAPYLHHDTYTKEHGSIHGQEVHAISPKKLTAEDKAWLTIEDWQGEVIIASWDLPKSLLQYK